MADIVLRHINTQQKVFSAIEAVVYIACRYSDSPVRSREICEYQGVSMRYLENVFQSLVHAGILKSVRGPNGGYRIARDRRKILLSDIFDAIYINDNDDDDENASEINKKIIKHLQESAQNSVRLYLSSITIQDLCDKARTLKVVSYRISDFNI